MFTMKRSLRKSTKVALVCLTVLLLLGSLAGYGYAKYRSDVVMTGSVQYRNQLVSGFRLLEHKAEAGEDGAYTAASDLVAEQAYYLIPGTELPMDPYISIEGKTDVKAMLFLEVVPTALDSSLRYAVTEDWTLLEGVRGGKGGQVYAYQGGKVLDGAQEETDFTVQILQGNKVTLGTAPVNGGAESLEFCGYLIQTPEETASAAEVFTGKITPAP